MLTPGKEYKATPSQPVDEDRNWTPGELLEALEAETYPTVMGRAEARFRHAILKHLGWRFKKDSFGLVYCPPQAEEYSSSWPAAHTDIRAALYSAPAGTVVKFKIHKNADGTFAAAAWVDRTSDGTTMTTSTVAAHSYLEATDKIALCVSIALLKARRKSLN